MAALPFNAVFFNHEVPFCKVYNQESKDKLEKVLLSNRISFFVEWQEKKGWQRIFSHGDAGRDVCTIRINEADKPLAKNLVEGLDCVQVGML